MPPAHQLVPSSVAPAFQLVPTAALAAAGGPMVVRLPLPPTGWGVADALAALDAARHAAPGLPSPQEVTVVSALSTVVLRAGDRAVKVYPLGTDPAHLDRLRRALQDVGSVVAWDRPPVETAYGVVTVMPWAAPVGHLDWPALGALLRQFHDETDGMGSAKSAGVLDDTVDPDARVAPAAPGVPAWAPLCRLPGQVADLVPEQAAVLLGARAELLTALDSAGSVLGVGVLHGDVSLENAVRTAAGPRFIDPDWVARGPREYDLASAARRLSRGEIDRSAYAGFCDAYGHDVRSWPGLPLLDRVADLGSVAFRLWDSRHHGRDLDWLEAELRRWRVAV